MPSIPSIVDTALDRAVAPGYGNIGLFVRRRLPGWPEDPPRMDGSTVLVTGAAAGLGLAASIGFARLGARVHVLGRDEGRGQDAARAVRQAVPDADVHPEGCDLSRPDAVRAFAVRFVERHSDLDVLVHNAGVMPPERTRTADGHELTFATHVLAPFVLTESLAPLLKAGAPSRVIFVTSGGMYTQGLRADDPQSHEDEYDPKTFYARTKRQQQVLTEMWAQRLRDDGIVVHSMHPGWAETEGVTGAMPLFLKITKPIIRTPEQGADTIVWLGGAPEPLRCTGKLWMDRRTRPPHYLVGPGPETEQDRRKLWSACEALTREVSESEAGIR